MRVNLVGGGGGGRQGGRFSPPPHRPAATLVLHDSRVMHAPASLCTLRPACPTALPGPCDSTHRCRCRLSPCSLRLRLLRPQLRLQPRRPPLLPPPQPPPLPPPLPLPPAPWRTSKRGGPTGGRGGGLPARPGFTSTLMQAPLPVASFPLWSAATFGWHPVCGAGAYSSWGWGVVCRTPLQSS